MKSWSRLPAGLLLAGFPILAVISAASIWLAMRSHGDAAWSIVTMNVLGMILVLGLALASWAILRRAERERRAAVAALATMGERTEHLQAANTEMRRAADVLQNTVASIPDAVLVADETGRIVIANPAATRLFGEAVSNDGQPNFACSPPDQTTAVPADETPMCRGLRGADVDNVEILMHRPQEARSVHLLVNARPIRNAAGEPRGAVVVCRDVTQVRETERQLHHSQKLDAIGQLTGGVAHDFSNILTVITGTIDILAGAVGHEPQLATIARMIGQAAARGADLTRHLVAFARKQPLQPRDTNINDLIVTTERPLRPVLGEHVEIESMLAGDAWPALIDPSQLTTALLNLAINARDAMPSGGKLTIETGNRQFDAAQAHGDAAPGDYVMIAVSDTGSGIPTEIREKVFEPFFTTKAAGKGTGLGLSMVYGFVRQSGGYVTIDSEEGRGTAVKLYLPRAAGAAQATELAPAEALPRGNETVLVVEDDVLVRSYVIAQLQSLGYMTLPSANAAEALAVIERGVTIDLLFTDVIMPGGMNGRELALEVMRRRPLIRVLYTSGYTEDAIAHHEHLDPGAHLLAKPYRKSDLAHMVRSALAENEAIITDKVA
jgi:PAS domain S-box-containing protein